MHLQSCPMAEQGKGIDRLPPDPRLNSEVKVWPGCKPPSRPRWGNNIWSKFGICLLSCCQLLNPGELVSGHFEIAHHSLCLPRLAAGEFPPLPHLGIATKSSQLLAYGGFLR